MRLTGGGPRRAFFAPEVIQTSAMDCGPASLKALLEGLGVRVSLGRLREACQTSVDGTSIDVMEDVAVQLGLEAEQVMLPVEHVFDPDGDALPAIAVVAQPGGTTHFVVVWRVVGPWVQVMDPGTGRRWMRKEQLLGELYVHAMPVPAADWREWAATEPFSKPLSNRLDALGAPGRALVAWASADEGHARLAALDAACRLVASLVRVGGVRRGGEAAGMVRALAERGAEDSTTLPAGPWSARPLDAGEEPMVELRGAVLVRATGQGAPAADLPPELATALSEPPPRPGRDLLALVREGGLLGPGLLLAALAVATVGGLVEAVLLRGLIDVAGQLGALPQRAGAVVVLATFLAALLLVELPIAGLGLAAGRSLEVRLRTAFLRKIPRLGDRYLQSRPASDMAQRSHSVHVLRLLPDTAARFLRAVLRLGATAAGLIWLDPAGTPLVLLAAALCLVIPRVIQGPLAEMDLRFRTHAGALSTFYLDAMLGLVAVRTHGAERAIRRWHEELLTEWARAGRAALGVMVTAETVQGLLSFVLSAVLFFSWLGRAADPAAALLIAWWALELPTIGVELGQLARQYPALRNVTLRLLEPLGAREEADVAGGGQPAERGAGAALSLRGVSVVAGGHTILDAVDLEVPAGEHVAIVGPSGAGKSSFVGLLLGWHRPSVGEVRVDGEVLAGDAQARLRAETAWVDPGVQIWNRTVHENLVYGGGAPDVGPVLRSADLLGLLRKLPDGLQQPLGEGGGLVSGGEGQRVRFGRALMRPDARLVILDEPFRGLDREKRRELMAEARRVWAGATLLCVTHDVEETLGFGRVLVIEGGRVVEDDTPAALAAAEGSRYRALLDADTRVREALWGAADWVRMRLEGGKLTVRTGGGRPEAPSVEPEPASAAPPPAPVGEPPLRALTWDPGEAGDALRTLAGKRGEPRPLPTVADPVWRDRERFARWVSDAAGRLGIEAEPVHVAGAELAGFVERGGPALLRVGPRDAPRLLVLRGTIGGRARLVAPDGREQLVPVGQVVRALLHGVSGTYLKGCQAVVDAADIPAARRDRVLEAMLYRRLDDYPVKVGWLVRLPPSAAVGAQLRTLGVVPRVARLFVGHATLWGLAVLSWGMLGRGALSGRLDAGWLVAWALVVLSAVPLQAALVWAEGRLALDLGAALKQRLLVGALRLAPEEVRHAGIGQLLGRVIESEAVESAATAGGLAAAFALLELLLGAALLAGGAGGPVHAGVLLAWLGFGGLLARAWFVRRRDWSETRLNLTNELVEALVGHRTRLAQEAPERWHEREDTLLAGYVRASTDMDRGAVWLSAVLPGGWALVGLLALTPALLRGESGGPLAISVGAVLLTTQSLRRLVSGVVSLASAGIAWRQVGALFHAAARPVVVPPPGVEPGSGDTLIEAHGLVFRHSGRAETVLDGVSLTIRAGDRLLLEGPSGGGKSTLGSIVAGLREPAAGLLLSGGLDLPTLGTEGWRRRVVTAPQFHENHVLGATLGFNLLMGRGWPADDRTLAEAEALCQELGLGPLLERMPSGMMQMVGETGWQLSHGEKSRLYIARALLQGADLVVLDESFAALDPETLGRALRCVLARARAVLVIAHP